MAEEQPSEKPVSQEIVPTDQLLSLLCTTIGETVIQQFAAAKNI